MKRFLLAILTVVTIAPGLSLTANPSATEPQTPRFSSSYTTFTKCGSGMTKKEEREAEKQGSDIPTLCKGPAGNDLHIYYSACSSHFEIRNGEDSIPLGTQAIDSKQKSVEWRLANGKPFAVIMRVYDYAGDDNCATGGKITGEALMVKGLKGYEHIDGKVEARTANANVKARELADQGFAKPRS
jgi:hypothetical protein